MQNKIKVLIVEDEAMVAMLMRRNLRLLDYDICALAATGEEAIAAVEAHHPDVIVMDIHLPGMMDGLEAAQKIRDRYPTPIIFLTGYSDENVWKRADQVHPAAYMVKPVQTQELAAAIAQAASEVSTS